MSRDIWSRSIYSDLSVSGTVEGTVGRPESTLPQPGFQPAQRHRIYHQKQPENLVIWCRLSPVLSGVRGFVEGMGLCQPPKCWCELMGGSKDGFLGEENSMSKIAETADM